VSLTSSLSWHLVSHLRAQFSHDLQQSSSNSSAVRTKVTSIIDGFGRSSILPRQTAEHRLHLTETFGLEGGRHSWKFGGDAMLTWTYNYFPSLFGGEYIYDDIKVNPFTFDPMIAGLQLTPLRAYAHQVPRYYIQNFGSPVTHPDTNEYAAFLQDTIRVTNRLAHRSAPSFCFLLDCRSSPLQSQSHFPWSDLQRLEDVRSRDRRQRPPG